MGLHSSLLRVSLWTSGVGNQTKINRVNIHCGIGEKGLEEIKQSGLRYQLIPNSMDYVGHNTDVFVLNTLTSKNDNGESYLKEIHKMLKQFIRNDKLLENILPVRNVSKSSRGFILSCHFGSSYSDPTKYATQGRRSIGGGTTPTLYGYEKLQDKVKRLVCNFDQIVIKDVMPAMGIKDAFTRGGPHRVAYNKKIQQALNIQEDVTDFTVPEAGTFLVYPTELDYSPMEILMPHVDSHNDIIPNYNYAICCNGVFDLGEVGEEIREKLKEKIGVQNKLHFAFIRYSRKCIGDMDRANSIQNEYLNSYNNSIAAQRKIFDMQSQANTYLDYDYVVGRNNVQAYIALFNKFLIDGKKANSKGKCHYKHGFIITDQLACADKNCYYSAAYDVILCLYKAYRITFWDDIISIPLVFIVYTNSTALFVQAIESLLLGKYCGQEFRDADQVENPIDKIPQWAYIVSQQLSYEKKKHNPANKGLNGASSYNRSQCTGKSMTLPCFEDNDAVRNFEMILLNLKSIIANVWLSYDKKMPKTTTAYGGDSQEVIFEQCTNLLEQLKNLPCFGGFTAECFIQFFAGLEIIPPEYNYFGAVTGNTTGPFKFFEEYIDSKDKPSNCNEKLKFYNQTLFNITKNCRLVQNQHTTMSEIENLCCENNRSSRKADLKYFFSFRCNVNDAQNYSTKGKYKEDKCYVSGMQNFFYMRWDESSKRIRLNVLAARNSGRLSQMFRLIPVYHYICIDGRNQTIDLKDDKRYMPYNIVSNGRNNVLFHYDGINAVHNVEASDDVVQKSTKSKKKHRKKLDMNKPRKMMQLQKDDKDAKKKPRLVLKLSSGKSKQT